MAVDEMEISYEGHGDDDIDINIDIEPGNHDEDFILEDARSEAGTNDDVMIDEDNASYNMEDADYVPEEDLQDIIDTETVEVSEQEMLGPQDTDIEAFPSEPKPVGSPFRSEDLSTTINTDTSAFTQAAQVEQPQPEETSNTTAEVAPQRTPSPEADITHPKASPPLSNGKPQVEEKINGQSLPSVTEEQKQSEISTMDEREQSPSTEHDLISEERNVIVGYQGSEYALMASSESDDPDSYFLKDSSVLKEPLSALFVLLRDILHDEIPLGEELMCTIDDLGLEICETSTANTELTFSQIVDLHTTLVRNDGEDTMPPLYVTLLTRPEFGKIFANLVEDARKGRGLHEVAKTWTEDDGVDVWADSDEFDGETSTRINGTDADESEQVENTEIGNDDWTEVDSVQKVSPEPLSPRAAADKYPASDADGPDRTQDTGVVDKDDLSNEPIEPWSENHDTESTKKLANGDHEEDEGGDFIDYEDEDYAQNGNGVQTVLEQENTDHDHDQGQDQSDEYHAVDKGLNMSRRSSSRTIEEVDDADVMTQPGVNAPGDENGLAEAADFTNDANGNTGKEAEVGKSFESVDGDEIEHQSNGNYEREAQYEDEVDASYDIGVEDDNYQESDHEANGGEEFSHNHDTEGTTSDNQINRNVENDDGGEISYEDDNGDEASLLALANDLEANDKPAVTCVSQNHQEEVDEIDYEDDDEESPLEGSGPATPSKPTTTGKRPHEEDGDAIGISSQDAKRPRS